MRSPTASGDRDDIDDEFVAMMKQRRNVVLVPNLPARVKKIFFFFFFFFF